MCYVVHDSPSAQRSLITVACTGFGGLHFIRDFSTDNCRHLTEVPYIDILTVRKGEHCS